MQLSYYTSFYYKCYIKFYRQFVDLRAFKANSPHFNWGYSRRLYPFSLSDNLLNFPCSLFFIVLIPQPDSRTRGVSGQTGYISPEGFGTEPAKVGSCKTAQVQFYTYILRYYLALAERRGEPV